MQIYIDGEFLPEDDAKISVFDHGLLYGDGVFEGIRLYSGRVFRLEEHLRRLYDSAKSLLIEIPLSLEEMSQAVLESCRRNELENGYIRLIVTRGKGSLGLSPDSCPRASVIIIAANIALYDPEKYETGLTMVTCATRRPTPASLPPQVKSLNYLNNVMAKIEAFRGGGEEGVMLNEQGYVAECTGDNIFLIRDGKAYTPPVSAGSLDGITRKAAIEILEALGVPVVEQNLVRHDIYIADECILTGTAAEVIAGVELDGRLIGDGKPGPITAKAVAAFRELVHSEGTPLQS